MLLYVWYIFVYNDPGYDNINEVLQALNTLILHSSLVQVKAAVRPLEAEGIRVITVGLGNSVDPINLELIAAVKGDVITPKPSDKPGETADKVIERLLEGIV